MNVPFFGQKYWWLVGDTDQGRRVVKGPFTSQGDSYTASDGLHHTQTFELPTRDRDRAKGLIRAKLNEAGHSHDDVLKRIFSRGKDRTKKHDGLEDDLDTSESEDEEDL